MTPIFSNFLNPMVIGLALIVLLIGVSWLALSSSANPYVRAEYLFSKAEVNFYFALKNAVQGQYLVFGKVRVADLINVKPSLSAKARMSALGRIAQKHMDYVLVNPVTLAPVCAVELNDRTHLQSHRSQRDQMLQAIFEKAQFPMVWIQAARSYDPVAIMKEIQIATTPELLRYS